MNKVLIVDDDSSFLLSLSDGLLAYANDFSVETAENGEKAVAYLSANPVDLVVTDLQMPVLDGFELLAYMAGHHPQIPVIVMTAFGTPNIEERIDDLGAMMYIEKPLDFKVLANKINEGLDASSRGFINNMNLVSFLQLIEMEEKTCTLDVKENDKQGTLYFSKGVLLDADTGDKSGVDAAYEIVCWENAEIEIRSMCKKREKERKIHFAMFNIIMEGYIRKDEQATNGKGKGAKQDASSVRTACGDAEETSSPREMTIDDIIDTGKEINTMSIQDKLKELAMIEGFGGTGLFTPAGETIGILAAPGSKSNLETVGVLANNVLMNAQKASLEMGAGRGQLVHVETERAHIIAQCLNEGTDPLKSQTGKAHVHLVLFLTADASIGLAKMKINSVIQSLADDCRM
ncbi:MAG: response regulator [Deltaproteobacteria bacterium]|nr:response regulator [Deltaproteobacteria bacterium]